MAAGWRFAAAETTCRNRASERDNKALTGRMNRFDGGISASSMRYPAAPGERDNRKFKRHRLWCKGKRVAQRWWRLEQMGSKQSVDTDADVAKAFGDGEVVECGSGDQSPCRLVAGGANGDGGDDGCGGGEAHPALVARLVASPDAAPDADTDTVLVQSACRCSLPLLPLLPLLARRSFPAASTTASQRGCRMPDSFANDRAHAAAARQRRVGEAPAALVDMELDSWPAAVLLAGARVHVAGPPGGRMAAMDDDWQRAGGWAVPNEAAQLGRAQSSEACFALAGAWVDGRCYSIRRATPGGGELACAGRVSSWSAVCLERRRCDCRPAWPHRQRRGIPSRSSSWSSSWSSSHGWLSRISSCISSCISPRQSNTAAG
jgi:hypothetical protein